MRLSYGMKLEQTQKLIMTPELRQAIMVLQLSAMDLAQYVEHAMLENPLLELPPSSATVTIAVIFAVYFFSPLRRIGRPVPPPTAVIRGPRFKDWRR
jgi:DNA-directed RNA polymerase specialized sigma54-like protein